QAWMPWSQMLVSGYARAVVAVMVVYFFFSSRRRHTRSKRDWSSDVCSSDLSRAPVEGYEIHCGRTTAHGGDAVFALTERAGAPTDALDGTRAGTVVGTYLHGCFASGALRRALLTAAASRRGVGPDPRWGAAVLADRYDRLEDRV